MADKIMKSVLVIMPFGGTDVKKQKRAALQFKRMQYITENLRVDLIRKKPLTNIPIKFSVSVFKVNTGSIQAPNFVAIKDADILFCLLNEASATVTYELAVRNLLRDELVIFVKDRDLLPFYLKDMAYIVPPAGGEEVDVVIEKIVDDDDIDVSFDDAYPFPMELEQAINRHDDELRSEVYKALNAVINEKKPRRQDYIVDIMREFDPGFMLSNENTITYLPASIVRMEWQAKSDPTGSYLLEEQDGDAVVCDYNQYFLELYNYNVKMGFGKNPRVFTLDDLLTQIKTKEQGDENKGIVNRRTSIGLRRRPERR